MKKFLSWLLVFAMVISMVPAVFAADSTVIYSQENLALTVRSDGYDGVIANVHEFSWTATEDGTVTVNITSVDPGVQFWFGESLPTSTTKAGSYDFTVTAGTEYQFGIIGYADYSDVAATVSFNLTFTAGKVDNVVETETYVISEQPLVLGMNIVTLEENALNTLYEFAPAAAGVYEFTADEGIQLGYWGMRSFPHDSTGTKSNTLTFTLTNEDQSILVGVVNGSNTGNVNITVTKTGEAGETVLEAVPYTNTAIGTLSATKPTDATAADYQDRLAAYNAEAAALKSDYGYTLPSNAVLGDYVDVYGDTHTAVLGNDGYYHLDSADGDILLIDMDYLAVLSGALKSDRPVMYAYVTAADGSTIKYDIGAAVQSYEAVCDENCYYPLTEDLIFFYQKYASSAGVYQYYLGSGYNTECAWMFACLTMDINESGTGEGDGGDATEGSGTDEDPYILTPNAYNYANVVGHPNSCDGVYFCWTATADGTLTLTFDENDPQPYVKICVNSIQNPVFESGKNEWTATAELKEDDYVYILIESYEFASVDYTFYASFGSEEGGEDGGEEVANGDLYDGDNYLYLDNAEGGAANYYVYTATESGTLYVTATYIGYDYGYGVFDDTDWIEGDFDPSWGWYGLTINGETAEFYYYGSVDVNAGDEVTICWYMLDDTSACYDHYLTLNLNYEGYAFPEPGSEADPYQLSMYEIYYNGGESVATNEVPADSTVYYELYNFADSYVTVTGEGAYIVYNGETYTDTDGDGVVEVYADSYDMIIQIGNSGDSAAVFYVNFYYPVGHVSNPQVITGNGTWTATLVENSNGYYYQWSVGDNTLAGVMTITVSAADGSWCYTVDNITQNIYGDYHYSIDDPVVSSEEWAVFAGDKFTIAVNTAYDEDNNLPAGDVTITISFEEKELVEGTDYPYYVYNNDVPVDITVAAGKEAWVELNGFRNYYFLVSGDGAYVVYNNTTYTDDDGDGVVKVMILNNPDTVYVGNSSNAEAAYSLNIEIPLGDTSNPEIITENGTYTTAEFAQGSTNQYYFQYIPAKDGTITVEVLNDTYWQINLWDTTSYSVAGSNYKYATSNVFTLKVSAGDLVQINGRTYSYDTYSNVAGTLSFKFTFEAAPEDTSDGTVLVLGNNNVYTDNTDGAQTATKYTYVAEQTGTLYLTLSGGSYTTGFGTYDATKTQLMNYTTITVNGQALTNGYCGTIEVTEGDEITISWKVKYAYYSYLYEANLNLSYEGYNPAPGSEADPIELSAYDCPTETIEIAAGSTAYYSLKFFSFSFFTVTGEGTYIVCNGETYTDTDGDGVVMLYVESSPTVVQIGNSGDSAAAFEVDQYYPVGNQMNPDIIESEGAYTAVITGNGDDYYFEFTADCDCDLTLTFNCEYAYQYAIVINGACWDETINDWNYMGAFNKHSGEFTTTTFELMQGDHVQIIANTQMITDPGDVDGLYGDFPAASIYMNVALDYYHVDKNIDNWCDKCGINLDPNRGDVNGDGKISMLDASMIVRYYNELDTLTEDQLQAADVNGDGRISMLDASQVVLYYNEMIDSFHHAGN